jgi:hypothetical protein
MNHYTNLKIVSIIWLFAIASFLKILPIPSTFLLSFLLIFHLICVLVDSKSASYLIPFSILLSPIFGSISLFGFNILLSDFLVFYSLIVILLTKPKYITHSKYFYFLFFLILSTSLMHYIFYDIQSVKPFISIFEIFFVYIIYKKYFTHSTSNLFLISCIISISLGIYLMLSSFYFGVNLNNYTGEILQINSEEYSLESYRVGFFYTNFPFIISSLIFILLYYLHLPNNLFYKLIILLLVILAFITIIISGNKTTLFVTIIIISLTELFFNFKKYLSFKNLFILFLIIISIYLIIYYIFLNDLTRDLFKSRMLSNDSLNDRFGVYYNVYKIIINNPIRLFIGYGPDFLAGAGSYDESMLFKVNYFTKTEQGAVDSGILSFIIEFGLILFLLIIYPILNIIFTLIKKIDIYNLLKLRLILIFVLSGFTQIIGLSKIFWFFIIFFAFSKTIFSVNTYKKNTT